MINYLLDLFSTDCSDVRREICYVFANLSKHGQPELVFNFYNQNNIIPYYINCLDDPDIPTVEAALECLNVVLTHGQKFNVNGENPLVEAMKLSGGPVL